MIHTIKADTFKALCKALATKDLYLNKVIDEYGLPPFWTRPNTFSTLILTILEQQVSLASAFAAYKKLQDKLGDISPQSLLKLSDDELRSCYFSRQKIGYTRGLAEAILQKKINLEAFEKEPDDVVRDKLKELKGIGDWTVDVYLMHALQRADILPIGDIALVNGFRMLTENAALTKEVILQSAESWRPYRSVATMIIWHYYIMKKGIKLLH